MYWTERYIGLPYEQSDCYELVCRVYRDQFGVELLSPRRGKFAPYTKIPEALEVFPDTMWQAVDSPREFDVIMFHDPAHNAHVGVYINERDFLHTRCETGCILDRLDDPYWRNRERRYYRLQTAP